MFRSLTLNYYIFTDIFRRVGALFRRVGALFRRVGALFRRVGALFLVVSDLVIPSCDAGALMMLAFFVVFRVLIKLFFSIDMVSTRSWLEFLSSADAWL
jgi:hypothetical protein